MITIIITTVRKFSADHNFVIHFVQGYEYEAIDFYHLGAFFLPPLIK